MFLSRATSVRAATALLALAFALAACGNGETTQPDPGEPPDDETTQPGPGEPPDDETSPPVDGGTLRVAVSSDVLAFDPHEFNTPNFVVIKNFYDPLIE